ncbi:MAG: hypothetical protein JW734_02420 [Candidatus Omnitrophica bacterium]|nr:hypothetical protein [Candidatus Omnitrophota bacterium]
MSARFVVKNVYILGALLALEGEVQNGKVLESDVGSTWENKRFNVVKIESKDGPLPSASVHDKVTLIVKNIYRNDVTPGETVYIE